MPNAAEDHAGAWKLLSTRELRGCATRVEWNWHALADQPASQFRQSVEMVTQPFMANGARTAVSSANWNLRCSMRGQGCPRSALCDQPLSGASSKAWRGSTRMSSANLQLRARRGLQTSPMELC